MKFFGELGCGPETKKIKFSPNLNKTVLAIYIVTRDRPEFLRKSINSVLSQSITSNFKLIISDNSIGESTRLLIQSDYPNIPYVKRNNISAFEHFQLIVDENECDYLLMLHDDDSLQPDYCKFLLDAISSENSYSAIAVRPNFVNYNGLIVGRGKNKFIDENKVIKDPIELLSYYFYKNNGLNPPFSGYAYKKLDIDNIKFNSNEAGKYSDFTFLLKILDHGKFLWLSNRLINVGLHDLNDSKTESMGSYIKLINFIKLKYSLSAENTYIKSLKVRVYLRYIIRNRNFSKKNIVLLLYILKNSLLLLKIAYLRNH